MIGLSTARNSVDICKISKVVDESVREVATYCSRQIHYYAKRLSLTSLSIVKLRPLQCDFGGLASLRYPHFNKVSLHLNCEIFENFQNPWLVQGSCLQRLKALATYTMSDDDDFMQDSDQEQ